MIPPLIGTRRVRMKIRYTDDPIKVFAKVLIKLVVSGVWYSLESIVEKSTNIPIPSTVPKNVLYIRASPVAAIIPTITSTEKNTYTSRDVIESAHAICAMMDWNWVMVFILKPLSFNSVFVFLFLSLYFNFLASFFWSQKVISCYDTFPSLLL